MDPNKLYVANVPDDTTREALRRHFSVCGGVLQVDLPEDHQRGKMRGLACVTMTSPAFANAARSQLDGVSFAGRVLRVSDVPGGTKPRPTVSSQRALMGDICVQPPRTNVLTTASTNPPPLMGKICVQVPPANPPVAGGSANTAPKQPVLGGK